MNNDLTKVAFFSLTLIFSAGAMEEPIVPTDEHNSAEGASGYCLDVLPKWFWNPCGEKIGAACDDALARTCGPCFDACSNSYVELSHIIPNNEDRLSECCCRCCMPFSLVTFGAHMDESESRNFLCSITAATFSAAMLAYRLEQRKKRLQTPPAAVAMTETTKNK